MAFVHTPPDPFAIPLADRGDLAVRRIFCIGRNYADHAEEMGDAPEKTTPFHFTKSAANAVASGATIPFPPETRDLHHEVELVVAIGREVAVRTGGFSDVAGAGVGLDLTRRDLQRAAKDARLPWDVAKDFDGSAVLAPLAAVDGPLGDRAITLDVNGARRQSGRLSEMIWSVGEIVANLSRHYRLMPGDLVMTGTPAGVGPLSRGDAVEAAIDGLPPLTLRIAD